MIWLVVALAGGLGAACRFMVDRTVAFHPEALLPWGTVVVNVTGSLAAGAMVRLVADLVVTEDVGLVVAGGFLGAYTTFSTAMVETLRLLEQRAPVRALLNLLAPVVLATAAAMLGWWLVA
jgi:fluoride exporter